jgi:hypothetical protein
MLRLEDLSTELVDALRQTSEDRRRQAAIAACHFAMTYSSLQNTLVSEMLQHLENRERFSADQQSMIGDIITQLDKQYFDLYDVADANREAGIDGTTETEEYLKLFHQARAANSLLFAMGEDSILASAEAIYEAAVTAATDVEVKEFFDIIRSLCRPRQ